MAQTGDVQYGNSSLETYDIKRAGTGGSEYPDLKAEFSELPHERGTLSMARSADPNSANSQFFICFDSAPHLDRQYTVFGQVTKGMEFVDKIKKGNSLNVEFKSNKLIEIEGSKIGSIEGFNLKLNKHGKLNNSNLININAKNIVIYRRIRQAI